MTLAETALKALIILFAITGIISVMLIGVEHGMDSTLLTTGVAVVAGLAGYTSKSLFDALKKK